MASRFPLPRDAPLSLVSFERRRALLLLLLLRPLSVLQRRRGDDDLRPAVRHGRGGGGVHQGGRLVVAEVRVAVLERGVD